MVKSLQGHQLKMAALLLHTAILYSNDDICRPDSGKPVSHNEGGATCPGLVQRLLHHLLARRVQGGGGLVQEQDPWLSKKCSGDRNPLLLPSGQLGASLSNQGVQALGKLPDEVDGVGVLASPLNVLLS